MHQPPPQLLPHSLVQPLVVNDLIKSCIQGRGGIAAWYAPPQEHWMLTHACSKL